jgi:hypothetical protein
VRNSGQMAAGISLLLPSARRQAVRDGPEQVGTPSAGRCCRPAVCARHGRLPGLMVMERNPWGDGGATCKIAGIAYTGSNPVPAT